MGERIPFRLLAGSPEVGSVGQFGRGEVLMEIDDVRAVEEFGSGLGAELVSQMEFEDGLRRVQNLAAYVALGGPERPRKGLLYEPDFSWAVGACNGYSA